MRIAKLLLAIFPGYFGVKWTLQSATGLVFVLTIPPEEERRCDFDPSFLALLFSVWLALGLSCLAGAAGLIKSDK
jgi:hypothetical protein